jgi:hypothetical protein
MEKVVFFCARVFISALVQQRFGHKMELDRVGRYYVLLNFKWCCSAAFICSFVPFLAICMFYIYG